MTGLSKPEQDVQAAALRLMRLDVANSLLPFDRPLADYLRGIAGTAYLERRRSWHIPAPFDLSPTWIAVRSGLSLTALEGGGGDDSSRIELATLAASVAGTNGHVAEVLPPTVAGFLVEPRAIEPLLGPVALHRVETSWVRCPRRGLRLPAGPRFPFRARLTWGPAPEAPSPEAVTPRNVRTFEPPPVPKVSIQARESVPKQAVAPRPVVVPKPPARPLKAAPAAPADRESRTPRPTEPASPPTGRVAEAAPPPVVPPEAKPEPARQEPVMPEPVKMEQAKAEPAKVEPAKSVPVDRPLEVPSFGGSPATTLTGQILRADQVEVPGIGGTVLKIGAPVVLALAGLGYYLFYQAGGQTRPAAPAAAQMQTLTLGGENWAPVPAADSAGARHDRKFNLYEPSKSWKDYRFQFTGQIDTRALGWVVRAQDSRNYHALKLSFDEDPSKPYTILKRWIVVDGRESSYSEKRLPIAPQVGAAYRVEMEVRGSTYDLSIQGKPVDLWTDNRLKGGAVGFMNERTETGRAVSAKIRRLETDIGK